MSVRECVRTCVRAWLTAATPTRFETLYTLQYDGHMSMDVHNIFRIRILSSGVGIGGGRVLGQNHIYTE